MFRGCIFLFVSNNICFSFCWFFFWIKLYFAHLIQHFYKMNCWFKCCISLERPSSARGCLCPPGAARDQSRSQQPGASLRGPGGAGAEPRGLARKLSNCAQTRSGLCGLLTSVSESCDIRANITSHSSVNENKSQAEESQKKRRIISESC